MSPQKHSFDKVYLLATCAFVFFGFLIFASASLGLLAQGGVQFSRLAFSQVALGVFGGSIALFIMLHIPYRLFREYAPHIFIFSFFLTLLVFAPVIGRAVNGAHRWIQLGSLSVQPAEFLKLAFILYLAWYYSIVYKKLASPWYALGGLFVGGLFASIPLMLQPDTGTFLILMIVGGSMAIVAGVRWKHLMVLGATALVLFSVLVMVRPYLLDRVTVFLHPASDPQGAGYQIKQSLIAIGSGGAFGRGFGQSIQKFGYLPEPTNDSIFSVFSEEFGFLGAFVLICFFLFFTFRGLRIASHAPDRFGGLVVVGIVSLILIQSCVNIAAMIGVFPLTGEPLVFISQGGTSLLFALAEVGLVLNISQYTTARYTGG